VNALSPIGIKLNTFGSAYYEAVPDGATYPYMRWVLDVPLTNYRTQSGLLIVDIWHDLTQENAVSTIEALRKAVWVGMDYYNYADANVSLSVRQELNNTVEDPDVNLIRRQLRFQVLLEEE
jgi:hypothetical protein